MPYKPSDSYYKEFTTASPSTGAAANADSLPVATANHNGADDASFALTVTNLDAGRYKITGTVPAGYAAGDVVNVTVAATCSTVAGKATVDTFGVDTKRIADLNDIAATAVASQLTAQGYTTARATKLDQLDAAVSTRSTYAGADTAGTTTLLGRVTGAAALASQIPANFTAGTFTSAGVFATAALANAPTGGSAPTVTQVRQEMDANSTKLANLDAAVSTRSTYSGGTVASVAAAVTVGTNNDKTGYALSAAGLDAIAVTDPGGVANHTTFPRLIVATYRRWYRRVAKAGTATAGTLKVYADDGTTTNTTQVYADDGAGNQSQGAAT